MKTLVSALLAASLALSFNSGSAGEGIDREAFSSPLSGVSGQNMDTFLRGRTEFLQSWAIPPEGGNVSGLGPLFNRIACASCHQKNGRGRSPDGPDERMLSMLVRLSVPGKTAHGGPLPHPAYGGQLNEEGTPGVPGEGMARIHWEEHPVRMSDGSTVNLRKPRLEFTDLAYGPIVGVLASPRIGQPAYGLGLLEAVPIATLEKLAVSGKAEGVRGEFNRVWDETRKEYVPGRFGLKANSPTLRQQIAEAFLGDLGITSPIFPESQCAEKQAACRQAAKAKKDPEISDERLSAIEFYVAHIAPPARRDVESPVVKKGEALFQSSGCGVCHQPTLHTADHPKFPLIKAQTISPYTDLLLHDMGKGLSDGRPDFKAMASQWRTPPLWGIGLVPQVNGHSQYLHDGRARNLEEAVVWHDGEARRARERYTRLNKAQREDLLAFLKSL